MENDVIKIAKMFKERDNIKNHFDNFIVGRVISWLPNEIKIQIDDDIFLTKDDLYFTSTSSYLDGEAVILIPSKNNDIYLVVGKAVQY